MPGLGELKVLLVAALEIAGGGALSCLLLVLLVLRRARQRSRRRYELYELHLSTHEQAKPQDLEDMVEQVANIIRAVPADRLRNGQPYLAVELICGDGRSGIEWSINIRCEPSAARALDGAFTAAYPDVRLGRRHAEQPQPRTGALRTPGYVMRFRKQRSCVYPLLAPGDELASPPLEQIARAQVALGEPSIVRFQLTPTPSLLEDYARRAFRSHEQRLAHREHPELRTAGVSLTLNRSEMQSAGRTQNRSLFWLEAVIAADSARACKTIAAAVPVPPRREPTAPPDHARPPAPVPPPFPQSARAAHPVTPVSGVRGRGRPPPRPPHRADEGSAGPPADAAADPRPARGRARHPRRGRRRRPDRRAQRLPPRTVPRAARRERAGGDPPSGPQVRG